VGREYVDSFLGAANQILEVPIWPPEDVSYEIVSIRIVATFLDIKEVGKVRGLVIEVDDENIEPLSSVGFCEVGGPRCFVNAP
jgi:hypothetical protein